MREELFTISENTPVAPDVLRLRLKGRTDEITAPGQFVNLRLDGYFLRRPISVCDWNDGELTLIYRILGRGTKDLAAYPAGKELSVLTGLGNGFDTDKGGECPLLVGGGVGIAPLYGLAKRLIAEGTHPSAVLGFNRAEDMFLADDFRSLGVPVTVTTADGGAGIRGFVTDGMPLQTDYTYLYTCGPEPMLKAVWKAARSGGQFSFEERMGCGFGACMGCTCKTLTGNKRICRDGPVLEKEEILWAD